MLRARYTELLRLREYVEELEQVRKRHVQLCTISKSSTAVRRHPTEWNLGQNETSLVTNQLEESARRMSRSELAAASGSGRSN